MNINDSTKDKSLQKEDIPHAAFYLPLGHLVQNKDQSWNIVLDENFDEKIKTCRLALQTLLYEIDNVLEPDEKLTQEKHLKLARFLRSRTEGSMVTTKIEDEIIDAMKNSVEHSP